MESYEFESQNGHKKGNCDRIPNRISKNITRVTTPINAGAGVKHRKTNFFEPEKNFRETELGENQTESRQKSIFKVPLSVEVCIRSDIDLKNKSNNSSHEESNLSREHLTKRIKKYFSLQANVELGRVEISQIGDSLLRKVCTDVHLSLNRPIQSTEGRTNGTKQFPIYQAELNVFIYQLSETSEKEYYMDNNSSGEKNNDPPIWRYWNLPNTEFHGLWDVLHYENNLKQQLLDYTSTSLILSEYEIDFNIINWNHLILLYGSPGTGKTSISRAISQKIAMRYYSRYESIYLIEISAHSLFSKWFSESGKTVVKLFSKIKSLLEEPNSFVNIVIDEIESISTARKQSLGRNEPSDSIRVVNALLTQIDALKKYSNTLIMTTTNLPDSIDEAFIDRADLKLHIPLPSTFTRYQILLECIEEFIFKQIIYYKDDGYHKILGFKEILRFSEKKLNDTFEFGTTKQVSVSNSLLSIAKGSHGFSGRNLRKLPFVALLTSYHSGIPVEIEVFLEKMKFIVEERPEMVRG
ncbi:ATPase, AAA family protein [Cryptosporidium felis]|nr:ATPase, AAA family protein [Cryptosporidium felis]